MTKSPHHDESAPMTKGEAEIAASLDEHFSKIDASSPLEQIQKERLEVLKKGFWTDDIDSEWGGNGYVDMGGTELESFLSESIRIAYEIAYEAGYMQGNETDAIYHRGSYDKGYRAGIERAKELVPSAYFYSPDEENQGHNQCRDEMLSNLDEELKKL